MSIYKHIYSGEYFTSDTYKYLSPFEKQRCELIASFMEDGQLIYSNQPKK